MWFLMWLLMKLLLVGKRPFIDWFSGDLAYFLLWKWFICTDVICNIDLHPESYYKTYKKHISAFLEFRILLASCDRYLWTHNENFPGELWQTRTAFDKDILFIGRIANLVFVLDSLLQEFFFLCVQSIKHSRKCFSNWVINVRINRTNFHSFKSYTFKIALWLVKMSCQ